MNRGKFSINITLTDCIGGSYMNTVDCPVFRAIKRTHPDLPLQYVGAEGNIVFKINNTISPSTCFKPIDGME